MDKACNYGQPWIITNATKGWVEYSSKLFLPKTHSLLFERSIKIVSARYEYEELYPGDAKRWKVEAFSQIATLYNQNVFFVKLK